MEGKKVRKRDMGTIGRMSPSKSFYYKDKIIPAKCSLERIKSFFEDEHFLPPRQVAVEPASGCNLACLMCATHATSKVKSLLDFEIFKRIVDEAKEFQEFFVFQGTGEPFLHPQLFDMVAYAKANGIKNISISTNGTLLTDANIEKLLDKETSPNFLQVSIDGHSKELFEKYRKGASFETVMVGLKKLYLRRKEKNFENEIEISLNTLLSNDLDMKQFLQTWGDYVDDITIGPILNQASKKLQSPEFLKTVQHTTQKSYISCPKPFEIISILANGKISHCAHDYHHIHIKGDLNKGDTLLGTWRGEAYRDFREKHIMFKAEETSCSGCEHMYRIDNEEALFASRKEIQKFFANRRIVN